MFNTDTFSFGKNMVWFVGVVEDRMDPNYLGRVRVRCFGYHTDNRLELPTEDLPWAMVMQSISSAAQSEVGHSPTGLVDGSWVVGFFLDGEEAQQPLVMGSIGGYARKPSKLGFEDGNDWWQYGFKDVREGSNLQRKSFPQPPISVRKNTQGVLGVEIEEAAKISRYPRVNDRDSPTTPRLARGINDFTIYYSPEVSLASTYEATDRAIKEPMLSKNLNVNRNIPTARASYKFNQPNSPYKAVYPFNHVIQTESGHVIEYDDTPSAERIHEYHRSGTFREIHPGGTYVQQTMNEKYDFTEAHSFEYVKGSKYSTYRRGYALMINSARLAGEDYDVQVCGSSNYNLVVEDGDFNIKVQTGKVDIITGSLQLRGTNEIIQTAPLIETNVGNHLHRIQNDYTASARGVIDVSAGTVKIASAMNTNMGIGDNLTINAGHTISQIAENSFTMLPFYFPEPVAISHVARHGHIELNAQDGDTRISARPQGFLNSLNSDLGSFTVTSALRTSLASIFQPQPSPEFEVHPAYPASLVGQTQTGYIYFVSRIGNIVLETETFNSIKFKATPIGTVETYGGYVQTISTSTDIFSSSRLNTIIHSGLGLYTSSTIGTQVYSGQEIFMKSTTRTDIFAGAGATIHAAAGVVQIGDYAAVSPALKGSEFVVAYLMHRHLTPLGPTSSAAETAIFDPTIITNITQAYCLKTFVF